MGGLDLRIVNKQVSLKARDMDEHSEEDRRM